MPQFALYQQITTILTFLLSAVAISRTIVLSEIFGFREVENFTIFYDMPISSKKSEPTDTILLWHLSADFRKTLRTASYLQTGILAEVEKCAEAYTASGAQKIGEFAVAFSGIVFRTLRAAKMEPLPTAFSKRG